MSPAMAAYFQGLHDDAMRSYEVAKRARALGLDPSLEVEIPPTEDLAARVEAQVGPPGVAQKIRDATVKLGNREVVSLVVAQDVAAELAAQGKSKEACLDQAVRTGVSILTEGVTVAPLEGIAQVKVGKNADGSDYLDLLFAGPIRAAGGTAQAMSVLIGDVVRRKLGVGAFHATNDEVERYKEEIDAYKMTVRLQNNPRPDEIETIARGCPVCINGEGTERQEVQGNRDLPRVETNQLRGGACLVMAEGLILKAPKVLKHVDALKLEGWEFLKKVGKKEAAAQATGAIPDISPNLKFMDEVLAGRPVFSQPGRAGGFRLRYGRARTAGLASTALHPATMAVLDDFLAVGTQLKTERPGKGTVATPCDTIEGPTVLLRGGALVRLNSIQEVRDARPHIAQVVDAGEMLVPFGEFAENNSNLPHSPWVVEWWRHERATKGAVPDLSTGRDMVADAEATGVALHPAATLFWHDVTLLQVRELSDAILRDGQWDAGLRIPLTSAAKQVLVEIVCLHGVDGDAATIPEPVAYPLLRCLGLDLRDGRIVETPRRSMLRDPCQPDLDERFPIVDLVSRLAGFKVMPRGPFRIGARMGRPEKADQRMMRPPPHGLVPVGAEGGLQRLIKDAAEHDSVLVEVGRRRCPSCGTEGWRMRCECGARTDAMPMPAIREKQPFALGPELRAARARLALDRLPDSMKGVAGLSSAGKTPEPMEKLLLRARHNIYVYKDGTSRFDLSDVPVTHVRPQEIGTSVEKMREFGYTQDALGRPLESPDQLVELKVQDVVLSHSALDFFLRVAQFLDDLLERFYHMPRVFNAAHRRDLVGHLLIALAPHTSGGVLCRLIGSTPAQAQFCHPVFHAAKRRNCDGDEDAFLLLLDGLVNFSRAYIPDQRGGLMDLPLLLATRLDPNEVDKEAHNLDVLWSYPLEFYRATVRHAHPKEVAAQMGLVAARIGKAEQYEGYGFTHDTASISEAPAQSAYKTIAAKGGQGATKRKLMIQMELARRLRGVDESEVAARIIGSHLLPDIIGKLKAFSKQEVRCGKCSRKYRRMPLGGVCSCGNESLTLTVHEASVRTYLQVAKEICTMYKVDDYTQQRLRLAEQYIASVFENDKVRKPKLSDFLAQAPVATT